MAKERFLHPAEAERRREKHQKRKNRKRQAQEKRRERRKLLEESTVEKITTDLDAVRELLASNLVEGEEHKSAAREGAFLIQGGASKAKLLQQERELMALLDEKVAYDDEKLREADEEEEEQGADGEGSDRDSVADDARDESGRVVTLETTFSSNRQRKNEKQKKNRKREREMYPGDSFGLGRPGSDWLGGGEGGVGGVVSRSDEEWSVEEDADSDSGSGSEGDEEGNTASAGESDKWANFFLQHQTGGSDGIGHGNSGGTDLAGGKGYTASVGPTTRTIFSKNSALNMVPVALANPAGKSPPKLVPRSTAPTLKPGGKVVKPAALKTKAQKQRDEALVRERLQQEAQDELARKQNGLETHGSSNDGEAEIDAFIDNLDDDELAA